MHICERPNVAGLVDNQATAIYPQGSELKKKCLTYNSYESMCALNFPMFIFSSFSPHNYSEANTWRIQFAVKMAFKRSINRAFSHTWPAAMQICLNKTQFLPYKKGSTPTGLVWGTEMAAVSWSWDNNMRDVVRKRFTFIWQAPFMFKQ